MVRSGEKSASEGTPADAPGCLTVLPLALQRGDDHLDQRDQRGTPSALPDDAHGGIVGEM